MLPELSAFLAETAPAADATQQAQSGGSSISQLFVPLVLMIGIFYLLLWRPQQKERKRQAEWLSGIKKGDEVVTQSGIIGTVVLVEDRSVTLDVGSGTKMRVLKSTVTSAWKQSEPAKAEAKK